MFIKYFIKTVYTNFSELLISCVYTVFAALQCLNYIHSKNAPPSPPEKKFWPKTTYYKITKFQSCSSGISIILNSDCRPTIAFIIISCSWDLNLTIHSKYFFMCKCTKYLCSWLGNFNHAITFGCYFCLFLIYRRNLILYVFTFFMCITFPIIYRSLKCQ